MFMSLKMRYFSPSHNYKVELMNTQLLSFVIASIYIYTLKIHMGCN